MEGRPTRLPPRDATPADIDLSDIQGNVLRGYTMPAAAYLMLRISDVAQATTLLRRSLPLVCTAETWDRQPAAAINLSFSYAGFQRLGLDPDTLASFPPAFREGMRARATLLGDVGPSAPDQWEFDEPHVLVSVYAADAERLEETLGSVLVPDTQDGVELLHVQRAHELPGAKDHFGFFDGVSQPAIQGSGVLSRPGDGIRQGEHGWREVATGEVLLGYPDEDRTLPKAPHVPYDRNGTYVVLRKLAVDTAAFRRFVADAGYPGGPEMLAAKIVGRWPDGTPLALAPDGPDEALASDPARINDFGYADDPQGLRCPLGSHIRRANPRDAPSFFGGRLSARHRIVRRGRAYGDPLPPGVLDDDGADRGLVFVSFQSNLWRQFETIQAQWINDGDRFGLGRDTDPLVGEPYPGATKLTVPGTPPYFVTSRPRLVTMRGGAYLFQPSMTALRHLARLDG
ncbi:MAG TPA: peroxidase [Nocardioides sp.]|nr:peroxidase [Nocardioides sp.]